MEFTEQLASIQGALISLQKREGILKELSMTNNDHIPKIQKVVSKLKDLIYVESNKTDKEDDRLRRCALFLILNTDLECQEYLKDDANCGHLVDCAPAISKELLLELFYELSFLKYMSEAVILCPAFLSSELIDIFIAKCETLPPSTTMEMSAEIAKAVYIKLIASDDASCCEENNTAARKHIQEKLIAHFANLLNLIINPPTIAIPEMTRTMMYDQAGILLRNILSLVKDCLAYFVQHKEQSEQYSKDVLDIYSIGIHYDYTKWEVKKNSKEKNIMKSIHDQLFSTCIQMISCITCDLWMYFAECNSVFKGDRSLQNDLAEAMYCCLEKINLIKGRGIESSYLLDLTSMLKSMAVKPRDEDDEIKDADLNTAMKNISNTSKSQKKWFKALFKFKDIFSNKECLECIKDNMELVDYEEVDVLFSWMISHPAVGEGDDNNENMKRLCLDCLQKLSLRSQLEMMNICLSKYSIMPVMLTEGFSAEMTETFNKAVNIEKKMDDKFYSDFVRLAMQGPREVLRKLVVEALSSTQQSALMVQLLKKMWPLHRLPVHRLSDGTVLPAAADDFLDESSVWSLPISCLYDVILDHDWTDIEKDRCVKFISSLVNEAVVDGDKFLNLCLLPGLHTHLRLKDWSCVAFWLPILQVFIDGTVEEKSELNEAVMLVSLAEILEISQTSFFTFSAKALAVYEQALGLVEIILPKFIKRAHVEDQTMQWLKEELVSVLSPRNLFYFGQLWYSCGTQVPVPTDLDVKLLHLGSIELAGDHRREEYLKGDFLTALIKILPTCTSREWKTVVQHMSLLVTDLPLNAMSASFTFVHIADTVLLLCYSVTAGKGLSETERTCASACLDHCIRNFALVTKDIVKKNGLSSTRGPLMFQKCIQMNEHMPDTVKESCSGLLINVLVDIITAMRDTLRPEVTDSEPVMRELVTYITKMRDSDAKQILAKKLLEATEAM